MDTLAWQTYIDLWDKGTSAHEFYFDETYTTDYLWKVLAPPTITKTEDVKGRDIK
jgi:hypothetical protein